MQSSWENTEWHNKTQVFRIQSKGYTSSLWTSSRNASGTFRPNHFVPLINSCKLNLQKRKTIKLEYTAAGFPNIKKQIKLDDSGTSKFSSSYSILYIY